MKKINWFNRLFMSWPTLVDIIKNDSSKSEELNKLNTDNEVFKKEVEMMKKQTELRLKEMTKREDDYEKLLKMFGGLQDELKKMQIENTEITSSKNEIKNEISLKEQMIENLKDKIRERSNDLEVLKKDINEKLTPLNKIERTFFGKSGNKGIGELGELQVKTILEKSGLDTNFWVENLSVGTKNVEFAIKSGNEGKWIPVDSKVINAEANEDGTFDIDKKFADNVKKQAKEISKYLSKTNTAEFGLLVLQSDAIYMEVFAEFPNIFREIIKEHKVYVTSPSSFVQFSWSIAHILDIYKRVHQDEELFDDVVSTLETVNKFSKNMQEAHSKFNVAMNTHYPALEKKQNKLVKKLEGAGKLKAIPALGKKEK
ncbi:MAG: DNA recombination protein RmuC [Mycoplasmataceae bacterium]|nr:DNA recombination protein RmuC [Mycoplasmataceae bacterium]